MKFFNFFKNLINKKKPGGAMVVVMLIFFVVFILAFGSGYLVFLNTSKSVDMSNGIKARYAALAGKDRALYEAMKNNYDFAGNCASNMFQKTLGDGSSYTINCVNNSGEKIFYSVGKYKNVEVSLAIDCINIEEECSESCKTGSICGGGKLLKTDTYALSISPSGCDASGANCSNSFVTADTVNFQWDTTVPDTFQCGTTTIDYSGQVYNSVKIGDQCWMKENLNVGTMLPTGSVQTNNAVSEKWCYNSYYSGSSYCTTHGGWYIYGEVMQYNYQDGAQGLCPSGWHIPTLAEWNVLATSVPVMCPAYPYAFSIKTSAFGDSSPNCSGMTVLPAGFVATNYQTYFGDTSELWISNGQIYVLNAGQGTASIYNTSDIGLLAASARCIKDSSGSGSITYKGASNVDNGKTNITTLVPQTNTYLEAAKYCDDLVANGYSDWYLPATNELAALRSNSAFSYFNLQSVSGDDYWVSTEQGSTTPTMAGYIKMSTGASSYTDKASEFKLRCVRRNVFNPCSSGTVCGTNCTYQDREYKTVQIGTQCWFKENLNYDNGCSTKTWTNSTDTGWCGCYTPSDSTCANYGRLYQWSAAMNATTTEGAQGICPSGWHVPSRANFTTLKTYLNSSATYKCSGTTNYVGKSLAATSTWATYATACTVGNTPTTNNASGFNLFSSGYKNPTAAFTTAGYSAAMWSSTQSGASAYDLGLYYTNQTFNETLDSKPYAFSVRCIKN